MPLDEKPIDKVTRIDLEDLIENKVPESKTIDYKRTLKLDTAGDKKVFLSDVSAFANTIGGHIVYGMKEEKGIPVELCGMQIDDPDQAKQRLDNLIRDGIDPRIYGIAVQPVELKDNKYAVVMRVPQSFNPPHMVIIDGHRKFYARNSSGVYQLSVDELRILFGMAESFTKSARDFRYQRIAMIASGQTPVPLLQGPKYVLHLIPFNSFRAGTYYDLSVFDKDPKSLPNIQWMVRKGRYNFDGFVTYHGYISPVEPKPTCSYTQLFRNGIIEAVYMEYDPTMKGNVNRVIDIAYEDHIVRAAQNFTRIQKQLGAHAPIFLMLTLVGVKGINLARKPYPEIPAEPLFDSVSFERDQVILPEVAISDFERDIATELQPVFDIVLNAAGLTREDVH